MVLTRSGGNNIVSGQKNKSFSKVGNTSLNLHNGHSDGGGFVGTRRSTANISPCKGSSKLSSELNQKSKSSLRHLSVDNELAKKKLRDDGMCHSWSLRSLGLEEELSSCEEDDGIGALASTRRPRSTSRETFPSMLLRRSSRQKKAMYSTLNVSTLEHAVMLNEGLEHDTPRPRQKARSIKPELRDLLLAQGKNPSDLESLSQPDIYNSIKSRKRLRRPRKFFDEMVESIHSSQIDSDHSDHDAEEEEEEQKDENDENQEEGEEAEDEIEQDKGRKYSLRTKRAQPHRLVYEIQRQTRQPRGMFDHLAASPAHRRRNRLRGTNPASPYQQRQRRTNSQGASSTSSSDSDSDERKFQNRKKKSMTKARNRCLPMNLTLNDLACHGYAKDRRKIGSSLADVDPMNIDKSVKFSSIGGHKKHVQALKEMIVFPLMYPEVFQKFHINPPRGCLFYGPPGNGKTLMARALANECSSEGRKVAFFMRKGADCLSKWVGESERQLRLLFDQAYQMRPSIIFFDEIDGLAPVRSSRQDQIHSSIVSTLLGLMDGLDNRGEIIVIGATNRIDSIDPALRRPGRFDREFAFPPPDKETRREIIKIHTQKWTPPLSNAFVDDLAEKSTGYCGADIMTLCAESTLFALRRRYPQIYASQQKLQLDVNSINIQASDFYKAMRNIVPSSQRSVTSPARALNTVIRPLLIESLKNAMKRIAELLPLMKRKSKILKSSRSLTSAVNQSDAVTSGESESDYDDDVTPTTLPLPVNGLAIHETYFSPMSSYDSREWTVCRPRLLIRGGPLQGHTSHLAPAILYDLEGVPVHLLDVPTMYGISVRTPEEACAQIFRAALRTAPSIVYMPNADRWWQLASPTLRSTFETLLTCMPPWSKVLLLATSDTSHWDDEDPDRFSKFFNEDRREFLHLESPKFQERLIFFAPIFLHLAKKAPVRKPQNDASILEVLPTAPPPQVAELTEKELERIELAEESTMRSLRLFLRDVLTRLAQDRRFKLFLKPVDNEEVPDYAEVIARPMDISTMMNKIDQHQYNNVVSFVDDINLICTNALEYNPDHCAEDRAIRHRACLLRDITHAIIEDDLDPDFEKLCNEVIEARKKRKANPLKFAPKYYKVLPKPLTRSTADIDSQPEATSSPVRKSSVPNKPTSSTRKRRRRSAWASGVIKKPRTVKVKQSDDCNETKSENDEVTNDEVTNDVQQSSVDTCASIDSTQESSQSEILSSATTLRAADDTLQEESPSDCVSKMMTTDGTVTIGDDDEQSVASSAQSGVEVEGAEDENDAEQIVSNETLNTSGEKQNEMDGKQSVTEESQGILPIEEDPGPVSQASEADELPLDGSVQKDVAADDILECELVVEASKEEVADDVVQPSSSADFDGDAIDSHPASRMTLRSRRRTHRDDEAPIIPDLPPPPPVVVDEQRLKELLQETVKRTMHLYVEQLEQVYSCLVRCVHRHRHVYDKTQLLKDLEEVIERRTGLI